MIAASPDERFLYELLDFLERQSLTPAIARNEDLIAMQDLIRKA